MSDPHAFQSTMDAVRDTITATSAALLDFAAAFHLPFDGGAGRVCPRCKVSWPCPELLDIRARRDSLQ
jgi:hypothetical protein